MERWSFFLAVMLGSASQAQNLVPNGSFEEYINCPTSFGQWAQAVGWTSPFTESADYYNACAEGVVCSVPLNTCGYQYPSDGNAYMGIITYATLEGGLYREIIATELTEPLQPGVPVYCSYNVSPGGFGSNTNNSATWAAKGPGMNFFTHLPETSQPFLFSEWASYMFPNDAVVDMPTVLNDTSSWVTVSGVFVPDSAYTWLAITNFFENGLSQIELLDSTAQSNKAYSFIDDVRVSHSPTYSGTDIGLDGLSYFQPLAFPNPVIDELHVALPSFSASVSMSIHDIAGRMLSTHKSTSSSRERTLDVSYLPEGVYVLHLTDGANSFAPVRFVHVAH
jgi:hypothetical protein